MDLITSNTMEIMKLSMDGLMARQRAVSANIANVMTPGYIRKEVSFESQLAEIKENTEDKKDAEKPVEQNLVSYGPEIKAEAAFLINPSTNTVIYEKKLDIVCDGKYFFKLTGMHTFIGLELFL